MSPIHFHTALGDPSCAFGAPFSKGLRTEGSSLFSLHSASRIHPAPLAPPSPKAYARRGVLSFPFIPPRGSILRLWRGPSPRAYSWSGVLSFPFIPPWGDPSCAFDAPLLQGPTHGADSLSFPFIPPRGSILRLWRGPSPRAYSWCGFTLFSFHSASRIHPAPLARPFFKGLLN